MAQQGAAMLQYCNIAILQYCNTRVVNQAKNNPALVRRQPGNQPEIIF
jgi:hypothetical protein